MAPHNGKEVLRLSTGLGWLAWLVGAFNLLFAAGAVAFAFSAAGTLRRSGNDALAIILLIGAPALLIVVVALLVLAYRRDSWLAGTTLWRRGLFRHQSYDLATASVDIESRRIGLGGQPVPRLVIRQPGRRVFVLWLRNRERRRALLPPAELQALADAISAGRSADPKIRTVTGDLRRLAVAPFHQ